MNGFSGRLTNGIVYQASPGYMYAAYLDLLPLSENAARKLAVEKLWEKRRHFSNPRNFRVVGVYGDKRQRHTLYRPLPHGDRFNIIRFK